MLLLLPLLAPLTAAEAPDRAVLAKWQGRWQLTRHVHGGQALPAKDAARLTLEVAKARLTVREGKVGKEEIDVVRLDPKAKPAAVDVKIASGDDRGKVVLGVWKLQGETLTLCLAEPGEARPKDFTAGEGSGQTLMVFKRIDKGAGPP